MIQAIIPLVRKVGTQLVLYYALDYLGDKLFSDDLKGAHIIAPPDSGKRALAMGIREAGQQCQSLTTYAGPSPLTVEEAKLEPELALRAWHAGVLDEREISLELAAAMKKWQRYKLHAEQMGGAIREAGGTTLSTFDDTRYVHPARRYIIGQMGDEEGLSPSEYKKRFGWLGYTLDRADEMGLPLKQIALTYIGEKVGLKK
jgi:hypothetical protein